MFYASEIILLLIKKDLYIMASVIDALGNSLFTNTVPVEKMVKKFEQESANASKEIKDKIDIKEKKLTELAKLQSIIVSVKNAANAIADPLSNNINSKSSSILTQEPGLSGNDFLKNVKVDNTAIGGQTNVAVAQIATSSDLILRTGAANTGFSGAGSLNLDGTLRLTLAGTAVDTNIVATDSFDDILKNININILSGNHQFEAFKLQGSGNTAFFGIRAKNTGATSSIAFNYTNNIQMGSQTQATTIGQHSLTNGVNSDVYINGVRHQQESNKFANVVPGTSFEVIKANNLINPNNTSSYANLYKTTISISEDRTAIKKLVADFGDALNNLSYIVAKNSKSSKSISDIKFSDPTSDFGSFSDSNSPLRNSGLLSDVQDILNKLFIARPGVNGNIHSFSDLGFGSKTESKNGDDFEYPALYFQDKNKFEKAFDDNFAELFDFLVTNTKITPANGNTGYIQYIPLDSAKAITDTSIIGQNINLSVTYNNSSAVTGVAVTLHGQVINGIITHDTNSGRYNISFKDTKLDGIEFSIDPNGTTNKTENSTIRYYTGIINEIRENARDIISDDGKSGLSVIEGGKIQARIKSDKDELSATELEFKKSIDNIREIETTLAMMEQQTNLLFATLEAILLNN
jgi:hypothetical protein